MSKYGERRCNVHDEFHPTMSVEKLSAWLDGNLSANEMAQMAEQIQDDPMLEEMVAMSDEIDSDIGAFEASGEDLPDELRDDNFDIPNPNRQSEFHYGRMLGMVCNAMPDPLEELSGFDDVACCAAPVSASNDDSDEEMSLLDKLKDLLFGEDVD